MTGKGFSFFHVSICLSMVLVFQMMGCEQINPGDGSTNSNASVSIISNNGKDFTTEKESVTLKGYAFNAVDVQINGEDADTLDDFEPEVLFWESEVSLAEGENLFEVVAFDDNMTRSRPVSITITRDPDHVPEAPENAYWAWHLYYKVEWDHNNAYDHPAFAPPDEVRFKLESTSNVNSMTYCNTDEQEQDLMAGGKETLCWGNSVYGIGFDGLDSWIKVKATVWEEDSGLAGADDQIGTGEVTVNFTFGEHTYKSEYVDIDGNYLTLTVVHGECTEDYCDDPWYGQGRRFE